MQGSAGSVNSFPHPLFAHFGITETVVEDCEGLEFALLCSFQ